MTLKEFSRSATNKTAQLEAQGGKVMRMAHVVRMPDGSECSVDTFGRCDWITKHTGAVNVPLFTWVEAELAPKTGEQIIANVGLPWPVMACWNAHDSQWSYANLQINMMGGEYNDPYFETESAHNYELKGWMPMPDQSPYETKKKRVPNVNNQNMKSNFIKTGLNASTVEANQEKHTEGKKAQGNDKKNT